GGGGGGWRGGWRGGGSGGGSGSRGRGPEGQSPSLTSMVAVAQLARLAPHGEAVLLGGQRTGRVRRERTGRVVRLVEVEDDLPVLRQFAVEEAAGGIRLLAARAVLEDEEELGRVRLLEHALEPH